MILIKYKLNIEDIHMKCVQMFDKFDILCE